MDQALDQVRFLCRISIGICGIDGGEVRVEHLVGFAVQGNQTGLKIDPVQQISFFQLKFRMCEDELSLRFELQNRNGLMNLEIDQHLPLVGGVVPLQMKTGAGIPLVGAHGVGGKGQHVDAVTVFQNVEVSVAGTDANHVANAGDFSCGGAHPQDVMVSPLNVHGMVIHQGVQDEVRTGTAIVDIADDMQVINDQTLNQGAERNDELSCPVERNDGREDGFIIGFLVVPIFPLHQQFFQYIVKTGGQRLPYLGARILIGDIPGHLDEAAEHDAVPILRAL